MKKKKGSKALFENLKFVRYIKPMSFFYEHQPDDCQIWVSANSKGAVRVKVLE